MKGILQNKQTYETPEVQAVYFTEENSILGTSFEWEVPSDD